MKDKEKTKGQLIEELAEMRQRLVDLEASEAQRQRAEEALRERLKELTCLYAVSRDMQEDLSVDELCRRVIEHLVPAMQFPEITVPVIELDGRRFTSERYAKGLSHGLHAEIRVEGEARGHLWVYYAEDRPFLISEEQNLVNSVAEIISLWLERKRAEEALWESEEKYRTLFEGVPVGLYRTTPDGQIRDANLALVEMLGYPDQESLLAVNATDLYVNPEGRRQEQALLKREGVVREYEMQLRQRDGTVIWVKDTVRAVRDAEGRVLYYEGSLEDITERKRAEEALRESREKYREMINGMNDTVWVIGFDGKFVDVNETAVKVLGYSREELLSMGPPDIDSHLTEEQIKDLIRRMPSDEIQVFETEHTTKEGKTIPVEISSSLVTYQGRRAILSIARDITERKRAEKALRESEQEKSLILSSLSELVTHQDRELRIIWANRAAAESVGSSPEQLVGRHCYEIWHGRGEPCVGCPVAKAIETVQPQETEMTTPDGRVWFLRGSPVREANGDVTGAVEVTLEITERKRAEEQYRTIVRTALDGFWIVDKQGRFLDVNDAYCKLIGYSREEMLTMRIPNVEAVEKAEETAARIRKIMEVGRDRFETHHKRKDGRIVDIEVSINYMKDEERFFVFLHDITERKRGEEALRESEEKYRLLVENATVTIIVAQDAMLKFFNPKAMEITGYSQKELASRPFTELIHPDDLEVTVGYYLRFLQGEETPPIHAFRIIDKEGGIKWLESNAVLITWEGRPATLNFINDITERKRAEERLEHLNLVLRAIRRVNQLIVREKDRDRLLQGVCDNLIETRGYHNAWSALFDEAGELVATAEAGLGEEFTPLLEQLKCGELTACGQRALSQPGVVVTEDPPSACVDCPLAKNYGGRRALTIRLEHGGQVYGLLSASIPAHLTADREEQGLFREVARDIAFALHDVELEEERQRAEEALRESEANLARAQQIAHLGNWDWDVKGQTLTWSDEVYRIFGVEKAFELTYEGIGVMLHPDDREKNQEFVNELLTTADFADIEFRIIRPDGAVRHIYQNAEVSRDEAGNVSRVFGIMQDITDRKQAEKEITRLSSAVEQAIDGIAIGGLEPKLIYVNDAFARMHAYAPEEMIGMEVANLHNEEQMDEYKRGMNQIKTQGLWMDEIGHIRKDGTPFPTYMSVTLLKGDDGKPTGILAVCRDITERKRAEEAVRRHLERAEALREIDRAITSTLDLPKVLDIILKELERVIPYHSAGIFLFSDGTARLTAGRGFPDLERVLQVSFPVQEDALTRKVLREKRPLVLADAQADERFLARGGTGYVRSWIGVPLIAKGRTLGFLTIDHREPGVYTEESAEIAQSFASQAALAIENARLYEEARKELAERKRAQEELRQSYVNLQRALERTVHVLVSAIEMRDPYTAGHQRRVAQLACAIAREMGLPEERIEGIRMAGLIHDIGKISVPAEILSKPGQLTDLEFGLIQMHPQTGHDVLKAIEFPWPVAQIVLQHHERMDGSGYPQGLSGEEIMLEARILGVADVVEAMASHRPYRSAQGIDKALEEISQNRGTLYDPEVVDACLKLFIEKGFKLE